MSEAFVRGGAGMSVASSCEAHGLHVLRVCGTDKRKIVPPARRCGGRIRFSPNASRGSAANAGNAMLLP
jgi:hypothetical protein